MRALDEVAEGLPLGLDRRRVVLVPSLHEWPVSTPSLCKTVSPLYACVRETDKETERETERET
jgi:hypothetical protein